MLAATENSARTVALSQYVTWDRSTVMASTLLAALAMTSWKSLTLARSMSPVAMTTGDFAVNRCQPELGLGHEFSSLSIVTVVPCAVEVISTVSTSAFISAMPCPRLAPVRRRGTTARRPSLTEQCHLR